MSVLGDDSYLGEWFVYSFVVHDKFAGAINRYLRHDRALYDWIFEPVEEEAFINGKAEVELPEGYYFYQGHVYKDTEPVPRSLRNQNVGIRQTNVVLGQWRPPVELKLLMAAREFWQVSLKEIEEAKVPRHRTFYVDRD